MNRIVKILIERDDMTVDEAEKRVSEVTNMIYDDPESAEDIMMDELGLEMDYIFDLNL